MPSSQPSAAASQGPGATGPAPPPAAGQYGRRPRIFTELDKFWFRVTEGLQVGDLWLQFKRDAQTGFQFYRRDYEAGSPAGQRKASIFQRAQELMWAILSKLTPARRVLLLVGIVLLLLPGGGLHFERGNDNVEFSSPNFQFWGGVVLFVLLMLEPRGDEARS